MARLDEFYEASGRGIMRPMDPHPTLMEGAQRYIQQSGHKDPLEGANARDFSDVYIGGAMGRNIGSNYMEQPDYDPAALPSFNAYRNELGKQFDFLTGAPSKGGMGVDVSSVPDDPYATPKDMREDVDRGRLSVLSTETTGGHPFLSNDENDMFRAVHDAFGHAATGRNFDRHGEEAAFLSHSRMFTPDARPAMAAETRGQNTAFNFVTDHEFPPQKVANLDPKYSDPSYGFGRVVAARGRRSGRNASFRSIG